jgi:hypothetical protein
MKDKKNMMGYMRKRNAMQLMGGGDDGGTVVVSPNKPYMSKEEGLARRNAYKAKFGVDRGSSEPLKKKVPPARFESQAAKEKWFKENK